MLPDYLPDGRSLPFGIPALARFPVMKACRYFPSGLPIAWTSSAAPEEVAESEISRRLRRATRSVSNGVFQDYGTADVAPF